MLPLPLRCLPEYFSREGCGRPFPSSTMNSKYVCIFMGYLFPTVNWTRYWLNYVKSNRDSPQVHRLYKKGNSTLPTYRRAPKPVDQPRRRGNGHHHYLRSNRCTPASKPSHTFLMLGFGWFFFTPRMVRQRLFANSKFQGYQQRKGSYKDIHILSRKLIGSAHEVQHSSREQHPRRGGDWRCLNAPSLPAWMCYVHTFQH